MVRFDGLPRISDNLRRAIGEFNSRRNSITEEVERFKADHPEIREWGDPRDFCEMVPFSLDDDEETIRRRAQEYLEAYYDSEHPERRTALLDEFYDAREALDVGSLDLSTLQGQDPGTPGPHGLTASEYDMFRLLRAFRADQAYATKLTHNPGYAAQRFSDPGRRAAYDASMDVMVGAVDMYFSNYLLPMNELNQLLQKDETPADLRWMFIQTEAADRMEGALARQRAQMRALKPELPEIPLVLRFPEEMYWDPAAGEPDAAQLRAAEAAFDRTFSGFFQNGFGGVKQQKQIGIDEMDVIFVDGMSANEFLSRRFPGRAMSDAQKKQQLLLSLQEGGHLLEAGSYQPNARGEYEVQLTPIRLDMHGMDKAEKLAKHSAIRRLFDFGPFKIKTTADRQDALQQEDAQRSGRHRVIRAVMQDRRQQGLDLRVAVDRAVERINQRQKQREDVKISALSAAYNSKQKLAALKKEKEELLEKTGELRGLQDGAAEWLNYQKAGDVIRRRLADGKQITNIHIDNMYRELLRDTEGPVAVALRNKKAAAFDMGSLVVAAEAMQGMDDVQLREIAETDTVESRRIAAAKLLELPAEEREGYYPEQMKKACEELLEAHDRMLSTSRFKDAAGAGAERLQEEIDAAQTRLEEIRQEQVEATARRRVADAVEPRLQAINTLLRAAADGMPGQEQLAAGMEWERLELPTPEDAKLVRDYAAALLAEEECKTRLDQITGLHQAIDLAGDAAADIAVIQPSMSAERFRALAEKQMALMSNLPADPFAGMGEGEKANYETNMALARSGLAQTDDKLSYEVMSEISMKLYGAWMQINTGLQNSPLAQRLMQEAGEANMMPGDYARQQAEQATAVRQQLQPQAEQAEKRLSNALVGDGKAKPGVTSLSRQELLHAAGMEKDPLPPAAEVRAPEVSAPEAKAPEVKAPEVKAPEAESAPVKAPEQMESRVRTSAAELLQEEPEKPVRQRRESTGKAAPGMGQKEQKAPEAGRGMGN